VVKDEVSAKRPAANLKISTAPNRAERVKLAQRVGSNAEMDRLHRSASFVKKKNISFATYHPETIQHGAFEKSTRRGLAAAVVPATLLGRRPVGLKYWVLWSTERRRKSGFPDRASADV